MLALVEAAIMASPDQKFDHIMREKRLRRRLDRQVEAQERVSLLADRQRLFATDHKTHEQEVRERATTYVRNHICI
jgi:hypothetical protein